MSVPRLTGPGAKTVPTTPPAKLITLLALVGVLAGVASTALAIDPLQSCWSRTYGTPLDDGFLTMKAYAGGSRAVAGGGYGADPTKPLTTGDMLVTVLDENGERLWTYGYGGPSNEWVGAVAPIQENGTVTGYIVAGNTRSFPWDDGTRVGVFMAMRIGLDGAPVWAYNYGFGMDAGNVQSANATIVDGALTGFLIGGHAGGNQADGYVAHLRPDGSWNWGIRVDNNVSGNYDEVWRANQAPISGGYVIIGWSQALVNPLNTEDRSGWIMKLDENGGLQWWKVYGSDVRDERLFWGHEMQGHAGGAVTYVASGHVKSNISRTFDAWVLHVNATGEPLWQRWINGGGDESAVHVHHIAYPGARADLVISGTTTPGVGGSDGFVAGLTHHGDVVWSSIIGGPKRDTLSVVEPFGNAGSEYYLGLSGYSDSFGNQLSDAWALKTRGEGNLTPFPLSGLTVTHGRMGAPPTAPALPTVWDYTETDLRLQSLTPMRVRNLMAEPGFVHAPIQLGGAHQAGTC